MMTLIQVEDLGEQASHRMCLLAVYISAEKYAGKRIST